MAAAITDRGEAVRYASDELRNDKEVAMLAVCKDGCALEYVSTQLRSDKEVVAAAVTKEGALAFRYASDELRDDKEVGLIAVTKDGRALQYASTHLRSDKEVVAAAITDRGEAVRYASDELRDDKEVAMLAVCKDGCALEYVSTQLRSDKEVVAAAVTDRGEAVRYASDEMRDDKEVAMLAVNNDGLALRHVSMQLRNDKQVVSLALCSTGYILSVLEHASTELCDDKEVVMMAVSKNGFALRYASKQLQSDKEVVMEAVTNKYGVGFCLHPNLPRHAKEVVLEQCSKDANVLQNLWWPGLRRDKEIVMTAVSHFVESFQHASLPLRGDNEVILAAAKSCGHSEFFKHITNKDALFSDLDFVASLMQCFPHGSRLNGFPKEDKNVRRLFRDVIDVVDGGKMTENEIAAAPGLFADEWRSRLAEMERCVSIAFPAGVRVCVLDYYRTAQDRQLLRRLKEYEPVLTVLMDHPNSTSWVEEARTYLLGVPFDVPVGHGDEDCVIS